MRIAVLVMAASVGGCGTAGTSELLDDPLGARNVLGLTLVHEEELPTPGTSKPHSPIVHHWFQPAEGLTAEQTKQRLIEFAEQEDWVFDETTSTGQYWNGRKPSTTGGVLVVSIEAVSDTEITTLVDTVLVGLQYG